jgi:hypothetical protein
LPNCDQRWQFRREYRRTPGDRIDPRELGVDVIADAEARAFCGLHHYAGDSIPPVRLAVGLFRKPGPAADRRLTGCAVFSVPMNEKAVPSWLGVAPNEGVELGRFCCAPEIAYGGESWFLSRAFSLLRQEKPDVVSVLSYANPTERWSLPTDGGEPILVKCGHFGSAYQALSARILGISSPRTLLLAKSGRLVSPRALSKIRNRERGWPYAVKRLDEIGAGSSIGAFTIDVDLSAWIARAIAEGVLVRMRHPGNYAYGIALTHRARTAMAQRRPTILPYPKKDDPETHRLAA